MPSPERPKIGRARALARYFADGNASVLGKLFVLGALFYVVWPADLIPDVPIIGWLDDLGVMGLAAAHLSRVVRRYRRLDTNRAPSEGETPSISA